MNQITWLLANLVSANLGAISIIHSMTCDILDAPEWPEPEMLIGA